MTSDKGRPQQSQMGARLEQEENLDRYVHEEEKEEEASKAVKLESVVQAKHSQNCIVIQNIIFRKTQS